MVPGARFGSQNRICTAEAAHILGCSLDTVRRHLAADRLHAGSGVDGPMMSRGEVEAMAAQLYAWRRHVHDGQSYWVTGQQAADLLGISVGRLDQLSEAQQIPFVRHEDRTRLYRRLQLEMMSLRDRLVGG